MPCSLPEGKECKLQYTDICSHDVINGRLRVGNFIVAGLSDFDFDGYILGLIHYYGITSWGNS